MKNPDTLKVTTPTDREIVLTRVFDAPRSLVFEAMTNPEYVRRWLLGPPGWSMILCNIDLRVGGTYRYVWRNVDGSEMAMRGVYREIVPPERIVHTEQFEFGCEAQAGEALATAVLTEQAGRTTLTCTVLAPSKEARDAVIASGMEHGAAASYDRLADVLASMPGQ
jgi:uncharacterized protein YndB with AHSA1/START domain